jgi:hypothetical protein
VALLVSLTACSSGSGSSSSTSTASGASLTSGGASSVYVVQGLIAPGAIWTILQLSATANESVSPISTLTLPTYVNQVSSIATDSSGQIYVGEQHIPTGSTHLSPTRCWFTQPGPAERRRRPGPSLDGYLRLRERNGDRLLRVSLRLYRQ